MVRFKTIMRQPMPRAIACWLGARYIQLVRATGRWRVEGKEVPERLLADGRSFIVAFWHGRLIMMPIAWRYGTTLRMVISQHPDGVLIARIVGTLGIETVAGSTSRGGPAAFRTMVRTLNDGICIGITPDGPRGPRMRASRGVAQAARLAGVPVVPVTYSARPCRVLGSWDKMLVPLPFGRGIVRWGEPIEIDEGSDIDAAARTIENRLNLLTRTLDEELGLPAIEPAAAEPVRTEVQT